MLRTEKYSFILTALFLFAFPGVSHSEQYKLPDYEIALGGGTSLNSLSTTQLLLLGARNIHLKEGLFFRVEPTLEYITGNEDMYLAGFSLALRFASPHEGITPFVDLGAGVNYVSETTFRDRDLGGHFLFDLLLAGGFNFGDEYSLSYRYRHLSNGGIGDGNEGFDSFYILLGFYLK